MRPTFGKTCLQMSFADRVLHQAWGTAETGNELPSLCLLGLLPGKPFTTFPTAILQVTSWSTSRKALPSPSLSCHSNLYIALPLHRSHCFRPIYMSFSSDTEGVQGRPGLYETLSQKNKAKTTIKLTQVDLALFGSLRSAALQHIGVLDQDHLDWG